jgi:hypothetical protein
MTTDNMTHQPTEADERFVREVFDLWRHRLFLQKYRIRVRFMKENMTANNPEDQFFNICADAVVDYRYHEIIVRIYPLFWGEYPEREQQELTLVHELCHGVTEQMKDACYRAINGHGVSRTEIKDLWEATTDWIAMIAFYAFNNELRDEHPVIWKTFEERPECQIGKVS